MKFESKLINSIMNEERGAALRLLFQLKQIVEKTRSNEFTTTGLKRSTVDKAFKLSSSRTASLTLNRAGLETMNKGEKTKIVEKKMLKFEDAKLRLEERAADECRKEREQVRSLLMKRRDEQMNTLQSNQEFMDEWNKKGKQAWRANMSKTKERIEKAQRLEDTLTNRYKNTVKKQINDATNEIVDGIDQFEKNLQRLGIDTSANVDDAGDAAAGKTAAKKEGKPLGGFSYAATMNKIKEKKTLGDFARKERDRRRRKMQVDQARTQATVEKKKREEELIAKFGRSSGQDRRDGYEEWKYRESKRIIEQLRLQKERDFEAARGKET